MKYINLDLKRLINLIKQNPSLRAEITEALNSSDEVKQTATLGYASGELLGKLFLGGPLKNPWRTKTGCLTLTVKSPEE